MLIPGIDYEFVSTLGRFCCIMVPIAIVTISEHIGHQLVLGRIVGARLYKRSGIASLYTRGWTWNIYQWPWWWSTEDDIR